MLGFMRRLSWLLDDCDHSVTRKVSDAGFVQLYAEAGTVRHRQSKVAVVQWLNQDFPRNEQRPEQLGAPLQIRQARCPIREAATVLRRAVRKRLSIDTKLIRQQAFVK